MTPKHTPGPWRLEVWNYGASTGSERAVPTIQNDKDAIAQVCDLWCMDDRQAERDANARLLVAAPELLAVVQELIAFYGAHGGPMAKARRLLAEIEGTP